MNVLDATARIRIGKELTELAYTLNTPLKVDLAIGELHEEFDSDGTPFGGSILEEPLKGLAVVESVASGRAVVGFEDVCSDVYGDEMVIRYEKELALKLEKILRRFGSTENAKLAEFAIEQGTKGLCEEDVMTAFSRLDWNFMTGIALDFEDFLQTIAEKAKEVSK